MQTRQTKQYECSYWPPGPNETDKWERLLKERPDLAPAVEKVIPDLCRVADGTADWLELANTYRSERLQVLGNGVVPLTGAIALATLFKRLTGESNVK